MAGGPHWRDSGGPLPFNSSFPDGFSSQGAGNWMKSVLVRRPFWSNNAR